LFLAPRFFFIAARNRFGLMASGPLHLFFEAVDFAAADLRLSGCNFRRLLDVTLW
jgi:hypothetical protein